MQNIIILNQRISTAGNYGIGVFVKMFECLFNANDFNIFLVELYSSKEEFGIDNTNKITKIYIPNNGDIGIVNILSLYVSNIEESIILLNYSSQFKLAKSFQNKLVDIKIIGVIHTFSWIWVVNGNEKLLSKYIASKPEESDIIQRINQSISELSDNTQYFDKTIALSADSINILNKIYGINKDKLCLIHNGIKDSYKHSIAEFAG